MKRLFQDAIRHVFSVRCFPAQQVKLVIERGHGASQIFALERRGHDRWETVLDLAPGEYRYCYHAYNGRTLTYLTPPDAPLDGLKAVVRIGAGGEHERELTTATRWSSGAPDWQVSVAD